MKLNKTQVVFVIVATLLFMGAFIFLTEPGQEIAKEAGFFIEEVGNTSDEESLQVITNEVRETVSVQAPSPTTIVEDEGKAVVRPNFLKNVEITVDAEEDLVTVAEKVEIVTPRPSGQSGEENFSQRFKPGFIQWTYDFEEDRFIPELPIVVNVGHNKPEFEKEYGIPKYIQDTCYWVKLEGFRSHSGFECWGLKFKEGVDKEIFWKIAAATQVLEDTGGIPKSFRTEL